MHTTACFWGKVSTPQYVCNVLLSSAAVAVLPLGSAFPGVTSAEATAAAAAVSSSKAPAARPIYFVTAGERGILRIWSSLTGKCVYTHHGSSSGSLLQQGPAKSGRKAAAAAAGDAAAAPGSELLELLLLPGGKGLMAVTGDARLLFFHPEVCPCHQTCYNGVDNPGSCLQLAVLGSATRSQIHVVCIVLL
jgi:hypothetical protein